MAIILVVDDEERLCSALRQFLAEEGHTALVAASVAEALRAVEESHPDVVLMDVRMSGTDGLTGLRQIHDRAPGTYVIMMTAYGTSQTSIEAVRLGAYEYLTKPLDLDVVRSVIDKALEARTLGLQAGEGPAGPDGDYSLVNLVGSSPAMQAAYKLIGRLATNDVPVLLVGEKGVGKELVARTIHFNSGRRDHPFTAVSCRSLPEGALARELFGSEAIEGSAPGETPTGGMIETTRGGTLFLDDIDAMPLPLQARLLRILADPGAPAGVGRMPADVRVIAATEEDLAEEVPQGAFNEALLDVLRVISITLPPLRERREDIPELTAHFIRRCSIELRKTIRGADPRVMSLLMEPGWPGNVGQLQNVIKRACVLARGEVLTPDDLGDSLQAGARPGRGGESASLLVLVREALRQRLADKAPGSWSPFYSVVSQVEEVLIREALVMTSGNQVKAAELLGLNRTTLRAKMRLYRLTS